MWKGICLTVKDNRRDKHKAIDLKYRKNQREKSLIKNHKEPNNKEGMIKNIQKWLIGKISEEERLIEGKKLASLIWKNLSKYDLKRSKL